MTVYLLEQDFKNILGKGGNAGKQYIIFFLHNDYFLFKDHSTYEPHLIFHQNACCLPRNNMKSGEKMKYVVHEKKKKSMNKYID